MSSFGAAYSTLWYQLRSNQVCETKLCRNPPCIQWFNLWLPLASVCIHALLFARLKLLLAALSDRVILVVSTVQASHANRVPSRTVKIAFRDFHLLFLVWCNPTAIRPSGRTFMVSSGIGRAWWISKGLHIMSMRQFDLSLLICNAACTYFQFHQVFAGGFHRFRCLARPSGWTCQQGLGWQRLIYFNADNGVTCTRRNYILKHMVVHYISKSTCLQISAAATFPIPRNSLLMNCLTHRRS